MEPQDQKFLKGGKDSNVGVTVRFEHLSLDVIKAGTGGKLPCVGKPPETKRILSEVSGEIRPGDCVALMGASGAGKSTLLNVLSGRNRRNGGTVFFNDIPLKDSNILNDNSCFIQQEDLFFGNITVLEHLRFQSRLRIPLNKAECYQRADEVLRTFGLSKASNNVIGSIASGGRRGISGGEKKRLSVASELLTNPTVIFADEPTSGLDAFMAESIVDVLVHLAHEGNTVITTIHQPSSDVFEQFNKLLLLSEGRMIYFGPREAASAYFVNLGHPVPPFTNPADFFVEVLAIDWDNPDHQLKELARFSEMWIDNGNEFLSNWESRLVEKLKEIRKASIHGSSSAISLESGISKHAAKEPLKKKFSNANDFRMPLDAEGRAKKVTFISKVVTVFQRTIINTGRDPVLFRARMIQNLVSALLAGFVYFRLDNSEWYSKAGAAYFLVLSLGFQSVGNVTNALIKDKPMMQRESESGLYNTWVFFIARCLCDFPVLLYLPIVMITIDWWMMNLRDDVGYFFLGMLIVVVMSFSASSIGYFVSAISPTMGVAGALFPMMILPCVMVTPFYIQEGSLANFWLWLYYLSPFTYGYKAMIYAVFNGVDFDIPGCVPGGLEFCNGAQVMANYGSKAGDVWFYFLMMVVLGFFGRILGGTILWLLARRRQNE